MLERIKTKIVASACKLLPAGVARRLIRQQDGVAAIEFAIVAAPFLALMMAIIETALVFFASQVLETATADAGRYVMTGQAQGQATQFTPATFADWICNQYGFGLFNRSKLSVDVQTYQAFNGISMSNAVDANGNFNLNAAYNPGGPGSIVVVRVFYQWPTFTHILGFNMSNMNGGIRLLTATAVFRNEPYGP
jgi:Flp pilus assembly protein TadG